MRVMLALVFFIMSTSVSAGFIDYRGSGAMLWNTSTGVVTSNPASEGLEYLTDSGTSFLGNEGGFNPFSLVVGEELHFWFTKDSAIVDLYGEITEVTLVDSFVPGFGSFEFFGIASTGTIFEINGSQAYNEEGFLTSQSISLSGGYSVPEPASLALFSLGLLGFGVIKKFT